MDTNNSTQQNNSSSGDRFAYPANANNNQKFKSIALGLVLLLLMIGAFALFTKFKSNSKLVNSNNGTPTIGIQNLDKLPLAANTVGVNRININYTVVLPIKSINTTDKGTELVFDSTLPPIRSTTIPTAATVMKDVNNSQQFIPVNQLKPNDRVYLGIPYEIKTGKWGEGDLLAGTVASGSAVPVRSIEGLKKL